MGILLAVSHAFSVNDAVNYRSFKRQKMQIVNKVKNTKKTLQISLFSKRSHQNLEDPERIEIRNIILNISKEKNDETRRSKLHLLLHDRVASENDPIEAARFLRTWDTELIEIGGSVQKQAQDGFSQQDYSEANSAEESSIRKSEVGKEKSDIELQLWALIDMMVQSKTFAKKILSG